MIRLSDLTALDITSTEFVEDLSVDKLYIYTEDTTDVAKSHFFIKDDNYRLRQMSRNNAVGTFFDNALLGTSNFYPEQGRGLIDYHVNSEITNKISFVDVPLMQYKRAYLYFAQGSLSSNTIVAHYIRIYATQENGKTVDLVSCIEFLNDSNVKAKTSKIFESQIFNEALELTFPDVEFIVNSTNPEIVKIKEFLFGTGTPKTYFIEYAALTSDMIDTFTESSLQFTEINLGTINYQNQKLTEEVDELFGRLVLSDNGYALTSSLGHTIYDIEAFINSQYQINNEAFEISHVCSITEYNDLNDVIGSSNIVLSNPANEYSPVKIRPLLSTATHHAFVEVMIKIVNGATGMTISKTSSILLKNDEVDKFKPEETFVFEFENLEIKNIIEKKINTIVQESTTPKILYVHKNVYVQSFEAEALVLLNGIFIIDVLGDTKITAKKTFLRLGDLTIENVPGKLGTYKIPQSVYYSQITSYLILDEDLNVMFQGPVIRQLQ